MITKIKLENFKRFKAKTIPLKPNQVQVIAGANNSGKSTILHALAVWEYCKTLMYYDRGPNYFNEGKNVGININDFTPISLPSLKYLWTSLSTGNTYNLKIIVYWVVEDVEYHLGFSLAYAQERVYIKVDSHNITSLIKVPRIAYLPPFAGIRDRETWHSRADRKRLIGQGLAGSVLRNAIVDLYKTSLQIRAIWKSEGKEKLRKEDWDYLKENDGFEILNRAIHRVFGTYLFPKSFNPDFHTYITVELSKGTLPGNRFYPYTGFARRDIMVEGNGFLQWLSVYVFSLDRDVDVLLLDEPDAHLHTSLQQQLFDNLVEISLKNGRQVLFATHSVEIIKSIEPTSLLHVDDGKAKFLTENRQKTILLAGLGSEHNLLFDQIQRCKRILFVENQSDAELLKIICERIGLKWPSNLFVWAFANDHKERKQVYLHIKDELPTLKCISIVDRDNDFYEETNSQLHDRNQDISEGQKEFRGRKWRRWEIENYLICPDSIALASNKSKEDILKILSIDYSIIINDGCLRQSDKIAANAPLFEVDGKSIVEPLCATLGINKVDIAKSMDKSWVFADLLTIVQEIVEMCH
jgi:energy-coupling factor transporter ATP-binding protein EcfA2